jgi:hypothetical protein
MWPGSAGAGTSGGGEQMKRRATGGVGEAIVHAPPEPGWSDISPGDAARRGGLNTAVGVARFGAEKRHPCAWVSRLRKIPGAFIANKAASMASHSHVLWDGVTTIRHRFWKMARAPIVGGL